MNIPIRPLSTIWFSPSNAPIVLQVIKIFTETVQFLMPNGEAPEHTMILNTLPLNNLFSPILILMKNWALADSKIKLVLRHVFMPSSMYII